MTEPELQLRELAEVLTIETCACGSIPTAHYEPGVLWIECPRCNLTTCAPDFDPAEALRRWRIKTG